MFIMCSLTLWGCHEAKTSAEEKAMNRVAAFADAYFNYDFGEALKMVTPESEKWLRFAASNVTQGDVDLLNAQDDDWKEKILAYADRIRRMEHPETVEAEDVHPQQ